MPKIISLSLVFLLIMLSHTLSAQYDSLYDQADVVVCGKILSVSIGATEDLGTEIYQVPLEVHQSYKQNILITSKPMAITWQVSNLRCFEKTLRECITKYESGLWVFFLNKQHFFEGDALSQTQIIPYSEAISQSLRDIQEKQIIQIDHYGRNKTCLPDCSLCNHIKTENWKKVKRYLIRHAKGQTNDTLLHHRRIKWLSTDRHILASLPSFCGSRMLFVTQTREVEAYAGYQLGFYKCHATWIPHVLRNLFRVQTFKYFCREKIDTTILRSFLVDSIYSKDYFRYEKLNYTRMLTDTLRLQRYGLSMPIPDEYVLLSSVFDGELRLYPDYQIMPDYMERSKKHIDELGDQKKVYLLSLITTHTVPEIAEYSLKALKELHDIRCVPFLIELAKYSSAQYEKGYNEPLLHENFMLTLVATLDDLTGCTTIPQSVSSNGSGNVFDLSQNISIWEWKIKVIDYKSIVN